MRFLTLVFLIYSFAVFSQVDLRTVDYSKADSIALSIPKKKRFKTTEELTMALTSGLTTEQEHFRAIFRWITNNVEYSYSNRKEDAKKAMLRKKAVCIGYSTLLKEMCGTLGIDCPVITGDARTINYDIGQRRESNHAWNAVNLNGQWYLLDVTWASGYFKPGKRKFIKYFDSFYFLTPPDQFIHSHFPDKKKWQFLKKKMSFLKYRRSPVYKSSFFTAAGNNYTPKGKLRAHMDMRFRIPIELNDPDSQVIVEIGKDAYMPAIVTNRRGKTFLELYPEKHGKFNLNIYINGKWILGHKITVVYM